MDKKLYWIYILHCINNAYYTGYTIDLVRRYQEHLMGTTKCKFTRSFKPIAVVQCWQVTGDKSIAMQVENYIKKISRKEKITLIHQPILLTQLFNCKPALEDYMSSLNNFMTPWNL